MRPYSITTACVLAGALTLGLPATGMAQAKQTRGTFTAAAEVGARAFTTEPSAQDKGKFEEYRSLPAGALLERLSVGYVPADGIGTYQLTARRIGQLDQSLWLQASRPNLYDFNIRWDKTPHLYSSDARSPGNEGAARLGYNTLPSPRPDSTAWKNAPYIGNVRTIWDPIKASLALTPTDALDTKFEWLRIGKKGGLPKSISYSGSSGPQREYVSPIDETVNNIKVSQSYTSGMRDKASFLGEILKSYQGTVSYEYSKYNNAITAVMVDNPSLSSPAWAATMPSTSVWGTDAARVSVAPSNTASTMAFVGAVALPFRTRITGAVNTSLQEQDDAYLPQFNNAALQAGAPNVGLAALQRPSLQGKVKLTTVNFTATSHPFSRLTLGAKYRNHSYSNQTPADSVLIWARSDRQLDLATEHTEWDPFTKVNTDVSAAFELARGASVSAGYAVEDFTRETGVFRTDGSREKSPRVAVDYSALSWLSLHGSYLTGQRRSDSEYQMGVGEVAGMRSYMFSDRDRKRTNVMASVTPIDELSVGLSFQNGDDKYDMAGQTTGVTSDKSTTTGVDVDWTPNNRVMLGVGFSTEKADLLVRYRYRTGTVGTLLYDNPAYYWTSTNTDKNNAISARVKAVLIPDKLEMTGSFSVVDATYQQNNVNDMVPTGGTAAQNLSATVENWPEVSNKLTPIALAFQYKVSSDWALTMRFNAEQYENHNFQQEAPKFTSTTLAGGTPITTWTGNLPGNVGATTGTNTGQYHFLGNKYNPYKANYLTFTVSWHPSSLPLEAGRALY